MRIGTAENMRRDLTILVILTIVYLGVSWLVPNSYFQLILTLVPIWAATPRPTRNSVPSNIPHQRRVVRTFWISARMSLVMGWPAVEALEERAASRARSS